MDNNFIIDILTNYNSQFIVKDKQLECFRYLLSGQDLIVNLPVGYGKSVIYHVLPQLLGADIEHPVALVVSPLNIIHEDQLKSLAERGISACRLDIKGNIEGNIDSEVDINFESIKKGKFSVVLCHPEAILNTQQGRDLLDSEELKRHVVGVVVDECHIIEKWGNEFRTAFKNLSSVKAFFPNVPVMAPSGTLTTRQKKDIPRLLGLIEPVVVECSPNRPNIFLDKREKCATMDILCSYEEIFVKECDELMEKRDQYPVTLLFLPISYISEAIMYLNGLFGYPTIESSIFSAICSGQDAHVISVTVNELRKDSPRIRLILTTSIMGMGFDPNAVTQVIHGCPPRNLSQYLQEIGRAGRRGQSASAILYYNRRDVAKNLPGLTEDIVEYCYNKSTCLREKLLSVFGFSKEEEGDWDRCCSYCKNLSESLEK